MTQSAAPVMSIKDVILERRIKMRRFKFEVKGPIKGGKNNMLMRRTGRHYPNPKWAAWRDKIVDGLSSSVAAAKLSIFDKPVKMSVVYTPDDLRRRDLPAMLDSIFHCMERAKLIVDDFLVKNLTWISLPKNVSASGVQIMIEEI